MATRIKPGKEHDMAKRSSSNVRIVTSSKTISTSYAAAAACELVQDDFKNFVRHIVKSNVSAHDTAAKPLAAVCELAQDDFKKLLRRLFENTAFFDVFKQLRTGKAKKACKD
jgi:7-keto-8-aminopelargonate synthetase-like enzyme